MRYDEVPLKVLKRVLYKWKRIYKRGEWDDKYWQPCAMCIYVWEKNVETSEISFNCYGCPLICHSWCRQQGICSRLSKIGHLSEEEWLEDVGRFVKMLEKRIKERKGLKTTDAYVVSYKDLSDVKKNPNFSLSARAILKNKKIKKRMVR